MTALRRASESQAFTAAEAEGIQTPRDLLLALERKYGILDENTPSAGALNLRPEDSLDPALKEFLGRSGIEPDQVIGMSDWRNLPNVRVGDRSMFTNHPLLARALSAAEILLKRSDPESHVPEVGVVTRPSFNAAAVRYNPEQTGDQARAMQVVIVHFHVFLILVDFAFYQAWFMRVAAAHGMEAARRTVTVRQIDYIGAVREGLSSGTGRVPHTPPPGCDYDDLVVASLGEAWLVASIGALFVVLHELGHIALHHNRSAPLTDDSRCEFFWMAGDPHTREFEADEFAAQHLALLQPNDILPSEAQLSSGQFTTLCTAGVTALFVTLNVLTRPGWLSRLLQPSTHPSPVQRGLRVLRQMSLSPVAINRASSLLRLSSIL